MSETKTHDRPKFFEYMQNRLGNRFVFIYKHGKHETTYIGRLTRFDPLRGRLLEGGSEVELDPNGKVMGVSVSMKKGKWIGDKVQEDWEEEPTLSNFNFGPLTHSTLQKTTISIPDPDNEGQFLEQMEFHETDFWVLTGPGGRQLRIGYLR